MNTPAYQRTHREYAFIFGVSTKTIQRWARRGLPLDDDPVVRAAVGGRRSGRPEHLANNLELLEQFKSVQSDLAEVKARLHDEIRADLVRIEAKVDDEIRAVRERIEGKLRAAMSARAKPGV